MKCLSRDALRPWPMTNQTTCRFDGLALDHIVHGGVLYPNRAPALQPGRMKDKGQWWAFCRILEGALVGVVFTLSFLAAVAYIAA